jgi:hypothetical protein
MARGLPEKVKAQKEKPACYNRGMRPGDNKSDIAQMKRGHD